MTTRPDSGPIPNEGPISIETFMDRALYDEKNGYYSQTISHVGFRGDFSTTATSSALLAKAILHHYHQAIKQLGPLPLVEVGAGNGDLALALKKELGIWKSLRTSYIIIEKSLPLKHLQKQKLGNFISHKNSLQDALIHTKGRAFIFSNELVDAFPAQQWILLPDGWHELGLQCSAHPHSTELRHWKEIILEGHPDPSCSIFSSEHNPNLAHYAHGQRVETHLSYKTWLESWLPYWKTGQIITIDYGHTVDKLYNRQPKGSLRGYKSHQLISPPQLYTHLGKIDLTCDVNFTDIMQWSTPLGLVTKNFLSQREFLLPFCSHSDADQFLVNPLGAGEAFQVLIQEKR